VAVPGARNAGDRRWLAGEKGRADRLRRFPGVGVTTAFFFAYLYLPIIIVIALSFNENRIVTIWTDASPTEMTRPSVPDGTPKRLPFV
jgi:hypothetical protein